MVNIAILGYGIVGSGVAELITRNRTSISTKTNNDIRVSKILDIRDFPDDPNSGILTKDPDEIFNDPSISIIVETIGGIGAAYEYTRKAFDTGRHVVTSNKELVATHGPELMEHARQKSCSYLFEGSVGGGIPIIRPLKQCLAANQITGITGILNGTTNFILTKMKREGMDFSTALRHAQQNGYAEANPQADIDGHDACRKIAILSSIAYGEFVDYRHIYTEGISAIDPADIEYAEILDSVIKLIAISKKVGGMIYARVSPSIVSRQHPLANVEDVFNAIVVKGDAIGDAMFYGRGAGKLPTASAIAADIMDIVNNTGRNERIVWERKPYCNIVDAGENETRFFIRTSTRNREEACRFVSGVFGKVDFIRLNKAGHDDDVAFVTRKDREKNIIPLIERLNGVGSIRRVQSAIRFEED